MIDDDKFIDDFIIPKQPDQSINQSMADRLTD